MKSSPHLEEERSLNPADGVVALKSLLDLPPSGEPAQMEDLEWVETRMVNPIIDPSWY